jgi:hypothetical protein
VAWLFGLVTVFLIASGREAGVAWVATGLLLAVVVGDERFALVARTKRADAGG